MGSRWFGGGSDQASCNKGKYNNLFHSLMALKERLILKYFFFAFVFY